MTAVPPIPLAQRENCINFTYNKFSEPVKRLELPYSNGNWNIMTTTREGRKFTLINFSDIMINADDLKNTNLARLCHPPYPPYVIEHFGRSSNLNAAVPGYGTSLVFDKFDYFLHEILDADYEARRSGQTVLSAASRVIIAQQLVNGVQSLYNKEIYPNNIYLYNIVLTYSEELQNYEGRIFYFDEEWFYEKYVQDRTTQKYTNEEARWTDQSVREYFDPLVSVHRSPLEAKKSRNIFQIALLVFHILSGQDYYQNAQDELRKNRRPMYTLRKIPYVVTIPENWPNYLKEAFRVCLLDDDSERSLDILLYAMHDLAVQFNATGSITV